MEFSFLPTGSSFDISISSSSPYPNLGFSSSTTSLTSSPYMPLVSTNPTAPDAVASKVGNPMSGIRWEYSQSSIWSYNIQTGELKAIWVNPDKSSPPTMFWYNAGFKAITIVPTPPGSDQGYELRLLVEKL
ncbi:hypothetical protein BJ165DRAFT_1516676 [Panaeolus papilionaceus]|nr:hypothetical protein BJ165DRAFT_1516676 [Panaeolus papilionaceus]